LALAVNQDNFGAIKCANSVKRLQVEEMIVISEKTHLPIRYAESIFKLWDQIKPNLLIVDVENSDLMIKPHSSRT
jgi:hypothetical protein